jgi:signal transduction histidine kinase
MSSKKRSKAGLTFSLKLSLIYGLFFAIVVMSLFIAAYYLMDNLLAQKEREAINERVREYRAWFEEGGLKALKARFYEQSDALRGIFFIRIVSPHNQVLFLSFPKGFQLPDDRWLNPVDPVRKDFWLSLKDPQQQGEWIIASIPLRTGLILQVGKNSTQSQTFLAFFRSIFIWFILPIILLGIIGGGFLTFRAMQPVRHLIQTVRSILNTGRMDKRVPMRREKGELDELVRLFNQMLDKNEALIAAMHDALDNVAHDLRTPMTRLRAIAETALSQQDHKNECDNTLPEILEESDRILTMLNTLMDVAEAETGAMKLNIVKISVVEVILSVIDLYEIVAEEKQINIITHLPEKLMIHADRIRLQQIVANLLDNAIKYSKAGKNVSISAQKIKDEVRITVADEGMGISEHEMDKIWDRLYRGDKSRSRHGLGLGLSSVKAITKAHGGRVGAESGENGGATFSIFLPQR